MEENWNGQMYNCSKWPVPLQLNVTLLLPGILWLRNMLLVLPNVHNPDCFFSHRWPCALFRPGQVPTPLLVVSSSLSPLSPQQPLQYIYVSRPVRERTAFLSSNAWQREHSKDGISTYPWESSRGGGWLGFDIAATSTLNCTKRSWSTEGDFVPCIGPPHSARKQLCFRTQRGILDKGEREQLRSSSNIFLEDIFVAEPFAYCTLH